MNRILKSLVLVAGSSVGLLAAPANAGPGTVTPLLLAGDAFAGREIATGFSSSENLQVNNSGGWLIETVGSSVRMVIQGSGPTTAGAVLLLESGQATPPAPSGLTISSFDSVRLNNAGNSSYNMFFAPTGPNDSGVVFNNTLLIQEGDIATASGFSPNTPYIGWFETYINDLNQIIMVASVDDPAIATTVDRAMVRIDDPAGAATQTVLGKEGDEFIPGRFLTDFGTGPHNTAYRGQYLLATLDLDGATTDDAALALHNGTGWTIVAREGDSVPFDSGRAWGTTFQAVDVNASGQWVTRATLNAPTSDDLVIVKNGTQVVAREGSNVPAALGAWQFTTFGTGAVAIDDSGRVFYFGDWNDPDLTRDTGLFRDGEIIVQKGVTMTVGGETITDISGVQDNFAVSNNGRYVVFEGTVTIGASSRRGTIMVDLGSDCAADFNNSGTVTVQDIYDFLADWSSQSAGGPIIIASADFNGMDGVTVQDIYDFLAAWSAGCP